MEGKGMALESGKIIFEDWEKELPRKTARTAPGLVATNHPKKDQRQCHL